MSTEAAARVGDPIGHVFSGRSLAQAYHQIQPLPIDGATPAVNLGRMLARGLTGGWLMASDGPLTIGSRNVFVNGKPATMTITGAGTCRQHSTIRMLVTGSYSVTINAKQASRVTDKLDCTAEVLSGSPNVFIGLGSPPTLCQTLGADAAKIAQFQHDALMAQAVYDPPETRQAPPGERNATDEDLRRLGLNREMLEHPRNPRTGEPSEFRAAVFINEATGDPTIAFKGTTMDSVSDWVTNAGQSLDFDTFYYTNAQNVARAAANSPAGANTRFVGHSLGGGQASAAARATGRPATTFNAAGLSSGTVPAQLPSEIDGVYVEGEVLHGLQSGTRLPDAAATRTWALPPDEPSWAEGIRQKYETDGIVAAARYSVERMVNLHLMDEVVPALALRAAALEQEMVANGC